MKPTGARCARLSCACAQFVKLDAVHVFMFIIGIVMLLLGLLLMMPTTEASGVASHDTERIELGRAVAAAHGEVAPPIIEDSHVVPGGANAKVSQDI